MLDLSSWHAKAIFGAMALAIGFFLFFPVYWLVASSLKADAELYSLTPTLVPQSLTLEHFATAIFQGDLPLHLGNSLIVSLSSAAINATLAIYAGYSFAKYRYAGRRPIMLFMLSAQMFPFGLLLITIYLSFTGWGLLDTRLGLMLSYIVFALPVATYMLYSYFAQVPNELIEAARADGAADLRVFHTIVLPISIPPIVTVFLYSFMWSWNDLLYSLTLIILEDKRTIGPGLLLNYLNESNVDWGRSDGGLAACRAPRRPRLHGVATILHPGRDGGSGQVSPERDAGETLRGAFPVLCCTPFREDGAIAEDEFDSITEFAIECGVDGVVYPGTASEVGTLTGEERSAMVGRLGQRLAGRVPLIVGASASAPGEVIAHAREGQSPALRRRW